METNAQQTLDLAKMILKGPILSEMLQQVRFLEMLGEKEVASKARQAILQADRIFSPIRMEYNLILARLQNRTIENL